MMIKNSFFILSVSVLYTSHLCAMLSLVMPAQRLCTKNVRTLSTKAASPRTIEHIYNDVLKIGDRECSDAYTTSQECQNKGCVRFAQTCAKNIEMQQRAQRKRD